MQAPPLDFFESITNLKRQLRRNTGRTPSTGVAREIAVCLQQGRLFFIAAQNNPIEIKPLLLFYGTMAFAKAITMIRSRDRLATIPQTHGVKDVSEALATIPNLTVRIEESGTFQRFNDVVAGLNRLKYFDVEAAPQSMPLPAAATDNIIGMKLTLADILSRIPGLADLYATTFSTEALTERIHLMSFGGWARGHWQLTVSDSRVFTNRAELVEIITNCRSRFPILTKWRVINAMRGGGHTSIQFGNIPIPDNELGDAVLTEIGTQFVAEGRPETDATIARIPLSELLSPTGGSFSIGTSLISPLRDKYISEYALHYLGMYLLSSLVRYRPQTWVHVVTRSIAPGIPADDNALSLLDSFMTIHPETMTGLTSEILGLGPSRPSLAERFPA